MREFFGVGSVNLLLPFDGRDDDCFDSVSVLCITAASGNVQTSDVPEAAGKTSLDCSFLLVFEVFNFELAIKLLGKHLSDCIN